MAARSGAVHASGCRRCGPETVLRFQSPLIKPCMPFSSTRLSEAFHRTALGAAVAHLTVPCSRYTPSFRNAIRFSNVVWGLGFVLEAGVRTYLVFTLSIEQFLIASPVVFYGFYAVLLGWSAVFVRRKRQQAMLDQELVTVQVVPL